MRKQFEAVLNWFDQFFKGRLTIGPTNAPAAGMQLTVAGNIGPEADGTRNLGSATLRMNDVWSERVLGGIGASAAGFGIVNTAQQSALPSLFSEVAQSAQFTYGNWLIRRYRGTLAAKTNVITGDYLATIEIQPDPAGGGAVVQGAGVVWIVESRTAANAIGVTEQHYTRGNAAGAAQSLRWAITANGNVVHGNQGAALPTTAVDGFLHIPSCAGVPTGVPTLYPGAVPMVYDTTNLRLYVYAAGAWRIH